MGCNTNNYAGILLYNSLFALALKLLPVPPPTRFGRNSSSIIDLTILNNFHYTYNIGSISELSSDPNPILLNFNITPLIPTLIENNDDLEKSVATLTTSTLSTYNSASKPINNKNTYFLPPHQASHHSTQPTQEKLAKISRPLLQTPLQ
ncbi:hypothetical protein CEXT_263421 [Caerostris extrusa]|uniref:Uncharacterized protein n=1 Tax=Caerostris extrusa TaxID=172846 RepID=A0AAV4N2U3_CAEEX|nr:hypothetical protein CEXT_263421 [Caerostris extrusa]